MASVKQVADEKEYAVGGRGHPNPAGLIRSHGSDFLQAVVQGRKNPVHAPQENLAPVVEPYLSLDPAKQGHAHIVFHPRDDSAQSGLADVQALRRVADVLQLGDEAKTFKMV
jgi:hypothetical protein